MTTVMQDVRYALRGFTRRPGSALIVVLTLALGIGANTAIFSVLHSVLLRPLSYREPGNLVVLWSRCPGLSEGQRFSRGIINDEEGLFSTGMYFEIRDQRRVFDDVANVKTHSFTLTAGDIPERVRGVRASASCLSMLGAQPAAGRLFAPGADEPGGPHEIVLSHALWERRFGCDPNVIGALLQIDEQSYTVVGVLGQTFPDTRTYLPMLDDPAARVDYWIPLALSPADRHEHGRQNDHLLARLARGATITDARAELRVLAARSAQQWPECYPPDSRFTIDVLPMADLVVQGVRRPLWLLAGAAGLVLLIACTNVANLLLAQATRRRAEMGMRMALGASHLRIVRQLLTESVVLAMLGGAAGLLIGWWGTSWFLALGAARIPRIHEVEVDLSVAIFTLGLSVCTGVVFGLVPAWSAARLGLGRTLRAGGRGAAAPASLWRWHCDSRSVLSVAELSLSVVLLVGAGLLMQSFYKLQCVDPGFSPDNMLTCQLPPSQSYRKDMAKYVSFYDQLGERIAALPGVEFAGGINVLPMTSGESTGPLAIEGRDPAGEEAGVTAAERVVLWDYFKAMSIPLVAGRYFDERDVSDGLPVVIVDETLAKRVWPDEAATGQRIKAGWSDSPSPWLTVVGVVGAVRQPDLESAPRMTYYRPYAQWPQQSMCLAIRATTDPQTLVSPIAHQVWALDEERPLMRIATMEQHVSDVLARRRFSLALLAVFAGTAFVLAVVGLYTVLAHLASQSTHEIGVRMALGAQRADVLRAVLGRGLTLTGAGLAVGLAVSLAATRALASLLYDVGTTDPATFVAVPLVLALVALLACYLPARRAASVDPLVALRCE